MPATIKRIRIFVASPGDVADERKRLDAVVAHLRTHVAAAHGLDLELVRWETHVRPGIAADAQAVVNPQIGPYDLFIGILWNRFGTPTGRAESGTREEFDQAYARWQRDPGSLEIWMYFSEQPAAFATMAELEQKGKVLAFRQELQTQKGALTWAYRDPADFETQVRGHLEDFVARFAARADHAAPDAATPAPVGRLPAALAPLRDELARRFTKEELRGLCFDLGVDYDDLPSTTKTGQAQDLILYLERSGRLAELLALCRRLRPTAKWDDIWPPTGRRGARHPRPLCPVS